MLKQEETHFPVTFLAGTETTLVPGGDGFATRSTQFKRPEFELGINASLALWMLTRHKGDVKGASQTAASDPSIRARICHRKVAVTHFARSPFGGPQRESEHATAGGSTAHESLSLSRESDNTERLLAIDPNDYNAFLALTTELGWPAQCAVRSQRVGGHDCTPNSAQAPDDAQLRRILCSMHRMPVKRNWVLLCIAITLSSHLTTQCGGHLDRALVPTKSARERVTLRKRPMTDLVNDRDPTEFGDVAPPCHHVTTLPVSASSRSSSSLT